MGMGKKWGNDSSLDEGLQFGIWVLHLIIPPTTPCIRRNLVAASKGKLEIDSLQRAFLKAEVMQPPMDGDLHF